MQKRDADETLCTHDCEIISSHEPQRTLPMRAKVEPKSTPQVINLGLMPFGAPLDCDEVEFEDELAFAPLLTGKIAVEISIFGSLETVCHVPLGVVTLGSYANDLTTPSLPSTTIEFVLAAKLATLDGAGRALVLLETTLTT